MTEDTRYPENNVLIHRTPNKMERRFRRVTNSLRRAWSEIIHIKARLAEIESRLNIDSQYLIDHHVSDEYSPGYDDNWGQTDHHRNDEKPRKELLSMFFAGILVGILITLVFTWG